jgi:hypothetical protein
MKKSLELVFDGRYGPDPEVAVERIHAAAVVHGVPEGTKPSIDVKVDPGNPFLLTTTYRWEWEA